MYTHKQLHTRQTHTEGDTPAVTSLRNIPPQANEATNYSVNSLRIHGGNTCRTFPEATHTLTHSAANHSGPKSPARLNVHLKIHTSVAPGMLWKNNEGQKSVC